MRGICGVLHFHPERQANDSTVRAMTRLLAHRGPDDEGVALLGPAGLGHRRLKVIDFDTGAQPMYNEDRPVALVFNGEIYNFQSLRADLIARGHHIHSRSDTEVIVHLFEEKGVDCLEDLRGMFAFALRDSSRRRLFLARDRAGKKPLYYALHDNSFWFASELKSLLAVPDMPRGIDAQAIDDFLTWQCIPSPPRRFTASINCRTLIAWR